MSIVSCCVVRTDAGDNNSNVRYGGDCILVRKKSVERFFINDPDSCILGQKDAPIVSEIPPENCFRESRYFRPYAGNRTKTQQPAANPTTLDKKRRHSLFRHSCFGSFCVIAAGATNRTIALVADTNKNSV